jgi:putative component of membrane protein insertase Oxa1/YidC/SpoIIIJ protein YidD
MFLNEFNNARDYGDLYINSFSRWLCFRRMIGTGLIVICVVFFTACAHPPVTQPKASLYEDFLGIYREPLNHLAAVRRGVCPMHPSCSEYSRQAVEKHGFTLGWTMAMDRLLRCGRDELRRAPRVLVDGQWKYFDPLSANDHWWYSGGEDINP